MIGVESRNILYNERSCYWRTNRRNIQKPVEEYIYVVQFLWDFNIYTFVIPANEL